MEIIVDAAVIVAEDMVATDADQVEPRRGHIAVERDIRRLSERVKSVRAIESRGDKPDAEFRVRRVVGASNDAYIKAFSARSAVGGTEIIQDFPDYILFWDNRIVLDSTRESVGHFGTCGDAGHRHQQNTEDQSNFLTHGR